MAAILLMVRYPTSLFRTTIYAELGLFSAVLGIGFVLGSTVFYHWAARLLDHVQRRVAMLGLGLLRRIHPALGAAAGRAAAMADRLAGRK